MSFFKFFGSSSKDKKPKKKDTDKDGTDYGFASKEEEEEAMKNLPAFRGGNKADRNLSISRSGRHKLKARQRTVLSNDLYGSQQSSSQPSSQPPPGASANPGYTGGMNYRTTTNSNQTPYGQSSGPTGYPTSKGSNPRPGVNWPPGGHSQQPNHAAPNNMASSKGQGSFGRSAANWSGASHPSQQNWASSSNTPTQHMPSAQSRSRQPTAV